MLTLFPDEQLVSQSSDQSVTLTTHRICYESREWGKSYNQNVMLEHITSCENYFRNQYMLLVIAALCIVITILSNDATIKAPAVVAALLLAFFYWRSRSNMIIVSSPSTKIRINVTGMSRTKVLDFINKIEQTKHKRILALNRVNPMA